MNINTLSEYLSASNDIKTTCRNTFSIEQWINILIKILKYLNLLKLIHLKMGLNVSQSQIIVNGFLRMNIIIVIISL